MTKIESIETERLILEALTLDDADFVKDLFNDPDSLRYIGDKQIYDRASSERYLLDGPMASYENYGFGILKVSVKSTGVPIGCCGLLQREYLAGPDIGFSSLPQFRGQGYLYEAGSAVLEHAKAKSYESIYGIVSPDNIASIKLLKKLGLDYQGPLPSDVEERTTDVYCIKF